MEETIIYAGNKIQICESVILFNQNRSFEGMINHWNHDWQNEPIDDKRYDLHVLCWYWYISKRERIESMIFPKSLLIFECVRKYNWFSSSIFCLFRKSFFSKIKDMRSLFVVDVWPIVVFWIDPQISRWFNINIHLWN